MPPAISASSIVRASDDQMSAQLPGEAVILDLSTGTYYGFEGIGAAVWELIRTPVRVTELRDAITSRYDVDAGRCEAELLALLAEMADKKLIVVLPGDASAPGGA
jgi:hypothetical protein